MKKYFALLALPLLFSCQNSTYQSISMEEGISLMQEHPEYTVVDVRTPSEYASGHIPSAINVPNEIIQQGNFDSLKDVKEPLMVYCRSGNRSRQAAKVLADEGYEVIEFGGIIDYTGKLSFE